MLEMKFNFSFKVMADLLRAEIGVRLVSFWEKVYLRNSAAVNDHYFAVHKAVAVAAHESCELGQFAGLAEAAF